MAKIRINGDTSGYIEISAPAVAGSTSITLPATTGGSLLATDASGNLNVDSGTFYVDGTNNRVGIGTTSPVSALTVRGGAGIIRAEYLTNTAQYTTLNYDGAQVNGAQDAYWSVGSGQAHIWYAGANERARIDSSGRLLVGTSSARTNFFNTTLGAAIQVEGTDNNTSTVSCVINSTSSDPIITLARSRGTSVGSNTIVSSGDTLGRLIFQGNDGTEFVQAASIACDSDGTPGANDMPGRLVFSTTADGASTPTERMRIKQGGDVLINRTSNGAGITNACKLQVAANGGDWIAHFDHQTTIAANCYGVLINYTGASPNGTGNAFLNCSDTTTQRAAIRSNGGLANYSANDVNLSDINTKKDITPAADTWNCIKEWEIVNYRYKDQPDDADLNLGVIAQQVAESCPEVITVFQEATEDEPEKLGVKEQQMYWMAIKALQEAQLRIEQLEATNASFEARLSALEVNP